MTSPLDLLRREVSMASPWTLHGPDFTPIKNEQLDRIRDIALALLDECEACRRIDAFLHGDLDEINRQLEASQTIDAARARTNALAKGEGVE